MRGNLITIVANVTANRSIPACAGEPHGIAHCAAPGWVYPRVCGGTISRHSTSLIVRGLSPRVRGNRSAEFVGQLDGGSIPACAGEPPARPSACCRWRVYPRVCGGNRIPGPASRSERRSIPACAGEPSFRDTSCPRCWVYPRVCGGTRRRRISASATHGLSPRVRGNPLEVHGRNAKHGSIPACAGEPAR